MNRITQISLLGQHKLINYSVDCDVWELMKMYFITSFDMEIKFT